MKKLSLILLAVFYFSFSVNAQIDQGTMSLGGTLNYSSNSTTSHNGSNLSQTFNSNNFTFGPRFGYFISDGLSLGAALIYSSSTRPNYNWNSNTKYVNNEFTVSPFVRYHKSLGEKFYIFGEGMVSVGAGGSKTINGNTTFKGDNVSIFGVSISPGVIFFPSEKFGIELSFIGFQFVNSTSKNPDNSNTKTVDNYFRFGPSTFSPNIGLQYYF